MRQYILGILCLAIVSLPAVASQSDYCQKQRQQLKKGITLSLEYNATNVDDPSDQWKAHQEFKIIPTIASDVCDQENGFILAPTFELSTPTSVTTGTFTCNNVPQQALYGDLLGGEKSMISTSDGATCATPFQIQIANESFGNLMQELGLRFFKPAQLTFTPLVTALVNSDLAIDVPSTNTTSTLLGTGHHWGRVYQVMTDSFKLDFVK